MKRLQAWLGVLLIFLLGAVCGSVLTAGFLKEKARRLVRGGSAKLEDPIVAKLRHDLRLDTAQEAEVRKIVSTTRQEIDAIRHRTQPEVAAAMTASEEKVRAILRPDQMERFEKLLRESRAKWRPGS